MAEKAKAPKKKTMKAKAEEAAAEKAKIHAPALADGTAPTTVSEQVFLNRLREKLSHFDAQMVLEAAMLTAGVARQEGYFQKEQTRNICLALIKRGGPAFSVGSIIYREVIG